MGRSRGFTIQPLQINGDMIAKYCQVCGEELPGGEKVYRKLGASKIKRYHLKCAERVNLI